MRTSLAVLPYRPVCLGLCALLILLSGCVSSPSASFIATPDSGQAPLVVRFDASASSGSIDVYRWDFGDGTTDETTVATIEHQYESPQRYEVTLTVEGGGGSGRAVDVVVVENPPQPDSPLGFYAINFRNPGLPVLNDYDVDQASHSQLTSSAVGTLVLEEGIELSLSGYNQTTDTGDAIYMHVGFLVTNNTGATLENLTFLGYNRDEFREGSAFSQPLNFIGTPTPANVLREVKPTHLFRRGRTGLVSAPERANFIAIPESDVPDLNESYPFVNTVFPYGFVVKNLRDFNSHVIPAGEQGSMTLSFVIPDIADEPAFEQRINTFTWNAVLIADPLKRTTQAPQENRPEGWQTTVERVRRSRPDQVTAIGSGVRTTPDDLCDVVVGLSNVRVAGTSPSDPNYNTLIAADGRPTFAGCEGT